MVYYREHEVLYQLAPSNNQVKKVTISAVLVCSIFDIVLAGTASVGASALVHQDTNYKAL